MNRCLSHHWVRVCMCVCHRNCRDYDLCERCERASDQIHFPEHLFVKVKVPCQWLGRDSSGFMRPLLPYVAYCPRDDMRYTHSIY